MRNSYYLLLGAVLVTGYIATSAAFASTTEVSAMLENDILNTVTVHAEKNGEVVSDVNADGAVELKVVNYVGLDAESQNTDTVEVVVAGGNTPENSKLTVALEESGYRVNPTINEDGSWEARIPLQNFKKTEESVAIELQHNGIMTAPVVVATANVEAVEALSSATWVYLLTTVFAIISLLLAITIQLRHNAKLLSPV